jgi:hypothetical protein
MRWVEAQHPVEDSQSLPDTSQADALRDNSAQRKTPLTPPSLETPAERDKRYRKHELDVELRGERYTGDGPRDPRRADWSRGIV